MGCLLMMVHPAICPRTTLPRRPARGCLSFLVRLGIGGGYIRSVVARVGALTIQNGDRDGVQGGAKAMIERWFA